MPEKIQPVRVQRSRQHRMVSPNGLPIVCVTRKSRWGNFYIPDLYMSREECVKAFEEDLLAQQRQNPIWFEEYYLKPIRGKNLACWCKVADNIKCHASTWLRLANEMNDTKIRKEN